jgi:hypothetical protein
MIEFERKGWFKVRLPDGWVADESDEPVAFYHPEGAGALQLTVQAPRPLKAGERIDVGLLFRAFLAQSGVDVDGVEMARRTAGRLEWAQGEYTAESPEEGAVSYRIWMATNHDTVAFFTYTCPDEEKDRDREAVEGIVGSLELP